jgi:hypothetical protein
MLLLPQILVYAFLNLRDIFLRSSPRAFALLVAHWHVDITKLLYLCLLGRSWRLCGQTAEAEDWRISRRYIGAAAVATIVFNFKDGVERIGPFCTGRHWEW